VCNRLEQILVKTQWAQSYGEAENRAAFSRDLFSELFNIQGSSRALFSGVGVDDMNSAAFTAHCLRVTGALNRLISQLDQQATINADLAHLAGQHASRNLDASNFAAMGQAVMSVVPTHLDCFNQHAWGECYERIASGISG
nr:Chain A, Giant hemoglobin, A1(b) globin chain [Oligobrachia mashikoi]2D2N_A Chain A, Giant hemoglobin, A1(b) globin chain [Oligobrachia mashikoi]2ZFO_A Chain A, Extracellular giant hemoglobin major globin subunit A1 [Oligobrachia mashikoi]2ZS0_A Chain A, Extracellular giant hemoglobin major globin subunit A1 [Oligobrachia mashikoi]2ZS1_A Chain A, Extracellular giant hemoglobin major globin subunit A1 [Oligobrachia mashikoi]7E96_A Chain A, Extracellular giant hemoglobin major globin subunit 